MQVIVGDKSPKWQRGQVSQDAQGYLYKEANTCHPPFPAYSSSSHSNSARNTYALRHACTVPFPTTCITLTATTQVKDHLTFYVQYLVYHVVHRAEAGKETSILPSPHRKGELNRRIAYVTLPTVAT
ncbi:hypothetical protein Pmani_038581 [Petrolisthes manimaculis]|uniref:Uncharacterized protein n=1 Tax=Petrolisthes manimaculis TaxID=1843537 RepID=A0AAE1NEE4_9EUCA|nr:hypothetical protein Pmani_038581 [Petrolisthes manimaculis]